MKVDLFREICRSNVVHQRFGLCDDENGTPAYFTLDYEGSWIATVINNGSKTIHFTAIDNCIDMRRSKGEMDNRCDVMMVYDESLLLVELKNKRKNWKQEGIEQIEATVKRIIKDHPVFYERFKTRKAVVANSKHRSPHFESLDAELREKFNANFRLRLQFESEIIIL